MKHLSLSLNFRRFRFPVFRRFFGGFPKDGRFTLYLLTVCFSVGVAIGALLIRSNVDLQSDVQLRLQALLDGRADGFWTVFWPSIGWSVAFFAAAFLIGMFIPGSLLTPLIPLFRGILYGLFIGCLYRSGLPYGMLKNLIAFCPTAVAATFVLLLSFREAMGYSASLFRSAVRGREIALHAGFRLYCTRFAALLGILILPSLLDAGLAQLF